MFAPFFPFLSPKVFKAAETIYLRQKAKFIKTLKNNVKKCLVIPSDVSVDLNNTLIYGLKRIRDKLTTLAVKLLPRELLMSFYFHHRSLI